MRKLTNIYTIGSSGKKARQFFNLLKENKIKRVVDIRLNNTSQLAGFSKKDDLEFFLELCDIFYLHLPLLAPTAEILDAYKKKHIDWNDYEQQYLKLLDERQIAKKLKDMDFIDNCLLCSEPTPEYCHRRLAAETLKKLAFVDNIIHL